MTKAEKKEIEVSLLEYNKGQLPGLPKNPRFFRDYRYAQMKKSLEESPEMLDLREPIVYPFEGKYLVIAGNLRVRASKELKIPKVPCKVLPVETTIKKLREYASKDNVNFGEFDKDILNNEWDKEELAGWGFEFEQEKPKDAFKERFEAIKDEDAIYPLVPKYDEKHELFIIQSANEVDSNWLRERLGMQRMKSYKTGKVSRSNVIDIKDVREILEGGVT